MAREELTVAPLRDDLAALAEIGRKLLASGYAFVTVTPATHRRVVARAGDRDARDLRDVFGWSRPYRRGLLSDRMQALLERAGACRVEPDGRLRSTVRFSTLAGAIAVHSAHPTDEPDAVFFGPDTYRFASLVARAAPRGERFLEVGCGTGLVGLLFGAGRDLWLTDVNPRALDLARVNASLLGVTASIARSDLLAAIPFRPDVILANPPYLADPGARLYRDGGGALGLELGVRIVEQAAAKLAPGGTLVLYTGAPIVAGRDCFRERVAERLRDGFASFTYAEIDPDVFGEELVEPAYADVERIAAVGLVATAG